MNNKITYNSLSYFTKVIVEDCGFREYDARWIIEPVDEETSKIQINYRGLQKLGKQLGTFLKEPENGNHSAILVGYDFRKYSENVKNALVIGLLASGLDVIDVGLCLAPTLYFAQYHYKIPACAMITASHNPNGWTGVKMGHNYSQTFGPSHIKSLKNLMDKDDKNLFTGDHAGKYKQIHDCNDQYILDLLKEWRPRFEQLPRIKVAVETGNGTAGIILPGLLSKLGFDVVPGNVDLDWNYPNFNPNPESIPFLKAVQSLVNGHNADIGICIDGDGDRIGVVDNQGRIIFNDRIGLLIAKHIERHHDQCKFVIDVKSTSLFTSELKSEVIWEKTGHSYVKAAVADNDAIAGFERSGHFFFRPPFGRGYDDSCVATLLLLWILCEEKSNGKQLSDLLDELPPSHQSPNIQPKVSDLIKYKVVDEIHKRIDVIVQGDGMFSGVKIKDLMTINGVRISFVDGSWLLIRASSNTPNLVILAESFDKDGSRLKEIDKALRELVADIEDIGEFGKLYEI